MKTKVTVTQVVNGIEYEGQIEGLSKETIQYKLLFGVSIDQLDNQKIPEDKQEVMVFVRRLFNFTIIKGEKSLEISDELLGFLLKTAGELAIQFYNNSLTKDYNEGDGVLSDAIRNKDNNLLGMFGASASIGSSSSYEIPDEYIPNVLK